MGAGKTATALAVAEVWKTQDRETKACAKKSEVERNLLTKHLKTPSQCPLIIVRNVKRFKSIFEQELKDRFPEYASPLATFDKNYQIESYITAGKPEASDYSNRVIIIDEVHNLQPQPGQSKKSKKRNSEMYGNLLAKLSKGVNSKKILLTGTPIPDRARQIIPLMNLILPQPLPEDAYGKFEEFYFKNGIFVPQSTTKNPQYDLTQRFKGRVSYFRSIIPSILQDNQGGECKIISPGKATIEIGTIVPVVCDVMSEFQ